jgi:hypothetical protein
VRERLHRFRVLQSKQARRVLEDTAARQPPPETQRRKAFSFPTEDREIAGCSILIFLRGPKSPVKRLWAGPKERSSGTTRLDALEREQKIDSLLAEIKAKKRLSA